MLTAQAGFATTFTTLFTPLGDEHSLTARHPGAEHTLRNIDQYQDLMAELRDAVQPELELIDSRITAPLKEYQELLKKIRKTVTKREHKVRLNHRPLFLCRTPVPAARRSAFSSR
jgi:amphiphysin